jgi:uncharacterized protein
VTAVVVVGASGRAAAQACRRLGFTPYVCDLFGDVDTLEAAAGFIPCPSERFPLAIPELVRSFPAGPVLCVGGMENDPDVVEQLEHDRALLGSTPEAMRKVRDPHAWTAFLSSRGLPVPEFASRDGPVDPGSRWLVKPLRSAGGLRIRFLDLATGSALPAGSYLQRFVPGRTMSAQFRNGTCLGFAEQFPGAAYLHACGFVFAAAQAPVELPEAIAGLARAVGGELAAWAGLRGLWGYDFILADNSLTPIEINPRYTATAELYDRGPAAKGVYYAPAAIRFPARGPWTDRERFADIPAAGSDIEPGHPVLTLFARDIEGLKAAAEELDRLWTPEDTP